MEFVYTTFTKNICTETCLHPEGGRRLKSFPRAPARTPRQRTTFSSIENLNFVRAVPCRVSRPRSSLDETHYSRFPRKNKSLNSIVLQFCWRKQIIISGKNNRRRLEKLQTKVTKTMLNCYSKFFIANVRNLSKIFFHIFPSNFCKEGVYLRAETF